MDWEAIGAIAEMLGAVAVLGTLVYLAIQVREGNKESRLALTNNIAQQYNAFLQHIAQSEELSQLWVQALDGDLDALDNMARSRAVMLMGNILRICEAAYLQFRQGRMDDSSWQAYKKTIYRGVSGNIFPLYWSLRADLHNAEFANLIEKALKEPDTRKIYV